ncbi:glutaredoxin-4 [Enhygromyxa salina]|uniref:Glutaredoxin-4 n=1 Tax=Enhygromyxa salina TaxID=215803 RepID=A0A2S9YI12_9BACT|nr:glutaredoxin [Enhygromyxa salina]PRQ04757.1 glutaredoxin-4 [Enhygromyxa salina]
MTGPSDPRPLLSDADKTEHVRATMAGFHPDVVAEVRAAVEGSALVVVGMARNPFVKKTRKALAAAGLEFTYLEYGSYTKQWKRRLAIKMWSGWPTFPQVFVRGTLIGGNQELQEALADGSLRERLAG